MNDTGENKIFTEFEVNYTRDKRVAMELGYKHYVYTSVYCVEGKESKFIRDIYCRNADDFYALVKNWNAVDPNRWKFYV